MSMSSTCDYVMFGSETLLHPVVPWHGHNHVLNCERLLNTQNALSQKGVGGMSKALNCNKNVKHIVLEL